jgi:hypothetical protein
MKKTLVILCLIFLAGAAQASAQTTGSISNQVDQLKDKVASKVAQLKLVEKRGVIGQVVKVGNDSFSVEDINGHQVNITVDELTDYTSDENSSFGFSDIKKGTELSLLGLYNKDSEKILARFVNETAIPLFLHGVVIEKDTKNSTLTLNLRDGTTYIVDDENITKDFLYSNNDLQSAVFSKLPIMVNAIVIGFPNPKEKNRITAGRIILFPDSPKDPAIPVTKSEVSPTSP